MGREKTRDDKNSNWVDWKTGSGKICNPGRKCFLQLAAAVVREVSNVREKDGVLYVRKYMIDCGIDLNLNGQWVVQRPFSNLQEIVKKYPNNFNGAPDTDRMELDGAVTESEDKKEAELEDKK